MSHDCVSTTRLEQEHVLILPRLSFSYFTFLQALKMSSNWPILFVLLLFHSFSSMNLTCGNDNVALLRGGLYARPIYIWGYSSLNQVSQIPFVKTLEFNHKIICFV
jgi:hypothetical protein